MTTQQADRLTRRLTAFNTFCEFKTAMSGGYCPTIYPRTKRHRELTKLVREAGFKVFDGRTVS